MKQGDRFILDIIDYGSNGEGIAKQDGFVIFVPFSVVGEKVKARITFVKKNFATAVLEEIIEVSPKRVKPPCNRFGRCGGCDVLHIAYDEQLRLKKKTIENTFAKNTSVECVIDAVVPSPTVLGYRNKVSLPFGTVENRIAVGFYRENTHKIVSITKCFLQGEWIENIIKCVLSYANENKLSVYDEVTGKGLLRHLVVRKLDDYYMITVVATARLPRLSFLTKKLDEDYLGKYALYLNENKSKGNVILSGTADFIYGTQKSVTVRDVVLNVNPFSFFQVNDGIRDLIYDRVEKLVCPDAGKVVIDAYAGVGVMGADLAKKGVKVYNIEIVPEAVEDARKLVETNGLNDYVTSVCGDSALILPDLIDELDADLNKCAVHSMKLLSPYFQTIKQRKKRYELRLNEPKRRKIKIGDTICFNDISTGERLLTKVVDKKAYSTFEDLFADLGTVETGFGENVDTVLAAKSMEEIYPKERIAEHGALALEIEPVEKEIVIIIDPPRKGCDKKVLEAIKSSSADNVIYISCNPATLSRDLEILSSDFVPEFITPYDMFPNTRHAEVLCKLRRK